MNEMKSMVVLDPRKGPDGKPCNREITVFEDGSGEDIFSKYQFIEGRLLHWFRDGQSKSVAGKELADLFQATMIELQS